MNKPTIGKIKPINGIWETESIRIESKFSAFGKINPTIAIAIIMQTVTNVSQFIFLTKTPASNLPIAKDMANILAICTLKESLSESIFLLNVGSQVIMPCSIITNKKALITKKITNGKAINLIISIKSCGSVLSDIYAFTFIFENKRVINEIAINPAKNG